MTLARIRPCSGCRGAYSRCAARNSAAESAAAQPAPVCSMKRAPLSSAPIRDPFADHLITPQNSALVLIDFQPSQFASIRSMDTRLLLKNIVSTVETARAFNLPIVHSTVNVAAGQGQTVPELAELLAGNPPIDRTTVNSWEDLAFLAAVRATGRRKLIFCALWTEVCM